jgi:hypothetical protein
MGQFDRLMVGGFKVTPEDQLVTRTYFGMPHTDTWFDAFLTTASGQYYVISHDIWSEGGKLRPTGVLGAFKLTPDGLAADERYAKWTDAPTTQTLTADNKILYSVAGAAGHEEVCFDGAGLSWRRADDGMSLNGPLAGNGTSWRLSWRKPGGDTGEMFYNHQGYAVEGTYFGEPVTGHVIVETMWGNEHYPETWFVNNRIAHWAAFAINYEDGSSEYGQFLCGEYGARGAVVVDNTGREVACTTNINAVDHPDGRVEYELGNGERWEITAAPNRILSFPRTKVLFGEARRIGDTRKIARATATYLTADHIPPPEKFQ